MRSLSWLRSLRRPLLAGMLVALVLAQALGAIHRIVHAPLGGGHAAIGVAVKGPAHPLAALFAGHTGEQGCELYDQLSHADLLPMLPVALPPVAPPPAPDAVVAAGRIGEPVAGGLARGPPVQA